MKKFTLITGSSSGIGREIAINLSKKNNIILSGTKSSELTKTNKLCSNKNNIKIWKFDLQKINSLEKNLDSFLKNNQIYIENFIHSAGIVKVKSFKMFSLEESIKLMNINFLSASIISKIMVKKINKKKPKNILFISSIASHIGVNGHSYYSASKGALDSLMKSLAIEFAPHTRVNTLLPVTVKTKMNETILKDRNFKKKMEAGYLLGLGKIKYITDYVDFILSDKAKWLTGQKIIIDGGKTSHG